MLFLLNRSAQIRLAVNAVLGIALYAGIWYTSGWLGLLGIFLAGYGVSWLYGRHLLRHPEKLMARIDRLLDHDRIRARVAEITTRAPDGVETSAVNAYANARDDDLPVVAAG